MKLINHLRTYKIPPSSMFPSPPSLLIYYLIQVTFFTNAVVSLVVVSVESLKNREHFFAESWPAALWLK